jgi:predicted HTH transcriptional regulator
MDPFDEQALPDLNSEVLDFRAASEFLAYYREVTPKAWSALRITVEHQGRQVPTIGGLLLSGKDRFARFPDEWVQAGLDVPKLEEIGTHFRVTIATARIGRPHSDTKDETILALFADGPPGRLP